MFAKVNRVPADKAIHGQTILKRLYIQKLLQGFYFRETSHISKFTVLQMYISLFAMEMQYKKWFGQCISLCC